MRSSLLLIYVTHAITYTSLTPPSSLLTAWIIHVPTKRWHPPLYPLSSAVLLTLFHHYWPMSAALVCLCLRVCPTFVSTSGFCADYLPTSIPFNKFTSVVYEIAQQEEGRSACVLRVPVCVFHRHTLPTSLKKTDWHDMIISFKLPCNRCPRAGGNWLTTKTCVSFKSTHKTIVKIVSSDMQAFACSNETRDERAWEGGGSRPRCAFDSQPQTFCPPRSSELSHGTTSKARSLWSAAMGNSEKLCKGERKEAGGGDGVVVWGTEDSRYCQTPLGSPRVTWAQARQGD